MLPYENGNISVMYKNGYQIEYVHTGEICNIPTYYFWKGFEREFEAEWGKEKTKQTGTTTDVENVPESGTSDEPPAAVYDENKDKEHEIRLRGGYELFTVDSQVSKYERYLLLALEENRTDRIHEFNCLLDALNLLREKLVHGKE